MVTFVCNLCDATLKKKQCDGHIKGRCRPGSLICIDCHKTFEGAQFKNHNSCLTQQQKHWGQYAKPKHITAPKSQQQQKAISQSDNKVKQNGESKNTFHQTKELQENGHQDNDWKGWKNQIKAILKEQKEQIQISKLKQKAFKRYRDATGENADEQLFNDRLRKIKKVNIATFVSLK